MPTEQKVIRKLRAILSADVKDYSVLMSDDEVATIQALKDCRNIMSTCVELHDGRVVDAVGDNLLAEFSSVVDAVQCAVDVQKKLKERNKGLSQDRRLDFRIGVNVGDVIQDSETIYGDGVNIAARIESLADPGGLCISRNAYDHIKNKLKMGYEYIGEQAVKNIKDPVRVYKVLMDPDDAGKRIGENKKKSKLKWAGIIIAVILVIAAGTLSGLYWRYLYLPAPPNIDPKNEMTFPLPTGPSVAVLPFDNMTGDPGEDYFCDGFTDYIISALSYVPELLIIARNSTFAYKGKHLNAQQIGKELNANWIIEGSIQKSKERVRITAQLIDASTGYHKWSETYDREIEEIFKLQDELASEILKEIGIKLVWGKGRAKSFFDGVNTPQEFKKALKALEYFLDLTPDSMRLARNEVLELIAINLKIPFAYAILAYTHLADIWQLQCESDLICAGKAVEAVKKALSLDENCDFAYMVLGELLLWVYKDHEKALNALKKAITINPNNAWAYSRFAIVLIYADNLEAAIVSQKKGILLDPLPPDFSYFNLGFAYQNMKKFHEAIEYFNKSLEINPDYWPPLLCSISAYGHLEDASKAQIAMAKLYEVWPEFSKSEFVKDMPFKNEKKRDLFREGLDKAGMAD